MGIFKRIQYILIYVCGFVLIGVTSLISGDIGWRGLNDWKFYVDTGLTYAAIICIIVAILCFAYFVGSEYISIKKAREAQELQDSKDVSRAARYIAKIINRALKSDDEEAGTEEQATTAEEPEISGGCRLL